MPNRGGGGAGGGLAKDHIFSGFSFVHPSLIQFRRSCAVNYSVIFHIIFLSDIYPIRSPQKIYDHPAPNITLHQKPKRSPTSYFCQRFISFGTLHKSLPPS